jgi:23S rRNA pseudouridine2605 synthase
MERLQKVLAQAGIASRRAAEQIILAGRVRVDGKIVRELGTQVDPRKSRVEVDGNKIVAEKQIYIVLHKPRGVVCTLSDPEGRPTVAELLKDAGARVVPVGRLDFHTSGALICTNDGDFAQGLAHPKKHVPKVYVAKVQGAVDDEALEKFSERIVIDGRATQPAQVKRLRFEGDKTWLEITLSEGRNRQVRRLGEATGFPVMRLARISHAGVTSEDLRPGQWRPLSLDELIALKRDYGVPKKVRAPLFEPALGKGGWDEQPRTPGARRPDPKFSAARRKDAKPRTQPAHFDRRRTPAHRDEAVVAVAVEGKPFNARHTENKRFNSEAAEPARFDRKRAPARRDEAPRAESKRFEGKGRAPRRDDAPPVAAKPFNAAHREKKRFNAKNAEPKVFETRAPRSNAKAPFDAKRASRSSREAPVQRELERGSSRINPKRPWEAKSRSASEDRASGRDGRPAPHTKRGGDKAQTKRASRSSNPARSDAPRSAPRRGTSR